MLCRLALERSRHNLANLLAIMHLCEPQSLGLEPDLAEDARRILTHIDQELSRSADLLAAGELI